MIVRVSSTIQGSLGGAGFLIVAFNAGWKDWGLLGFWTITGIDISRNWKSSDPIFLQKTMSN
ncbi:hypothetical protein Y5S_01850 [Alcanivorax nanhaiticus]|uniref:Uncharacterized protein n=1 Tax=Alcanivorax nanhaiticus TaxID=1177154 RepID=A0A095SK27_9GAMM|nr:hypothetical protein Y5S_01850 [Alcanivorax nanhaiticus]